MRAFRRFSALFAGLFLLSAASSVSAASIKNIDLRLSYGGNSYFNAVVLNPQSQIVLFSGDRLDQTDDLWGLPRLFAFAVGKILRFTAQIDTDLGIVQSCSLGGLNCATGATLDPNPQSPLSIFYGNTGLFSGGLSVGDNLTYDVIPSTDPLDRFTAVTQTGDLAAWFVWRGNFTVVEEVVQPAPIPLPAPALLLPVGLAGLGLMRRRQKRITG
ncbi:VPLPA-CTERM sorting domain-containing protein [Paracoccus sediminilitoris]|uniref:VPLPA-CTERM sorting domain-containing protein n=1 Tax=Paracoccus sediminilitoris TaxID=2202419 RepID=UPI000DB9158A|nr:VPLPA-CTERM sorting domain-containing protein [Paracoccus sediminilitoris]